MKKVFKIAFINLMIMASFITVGGTLFKKWMWPLSTTGRKIVFGVVGGIFGCALILFYYPMTPVIYLDSRGVAVMIMAIYGGALSSFVAAGLINAGLILYFGWIPYTMSGSAALLVYVCLCLFISGFDLSILKKWIFMTVINFVIVAPVIMFFNGSVGKAQITADYGLNTLIGSGMAYAFGEYVTRHNTARTKLEELASTDYLTGLNNTMKFDLTIKRLLSKAKIESKPLTLFLIDIDNFKLVNDTYGHLAGNAILTEIARLLLNINSADAFISRYGGEEFSALLYDCGHAEALVIAEKMRTAIENHPFKIQNGITLNITISIGAATFRNSNFEREEELIQKADDAMYLAKRSGRNKVCSLQEASSV